MTVEQTSPAAVFFGNGSTTSFTPGPYGQVKSDIIVKKVHVVSGAEELLTVDVDYSVANLGVATGVTITYPITGDPLSSAYKLMVTRNIPIKQTTSIRNQSGFFPEIIEDALDRIVLMLQDAALQGYTDTAIAAALSAAESAEEALNTLSDISDIQDTVNNIQAEATTLPAGSSATVTYDPASSPVMTFNIPRGDQGVQGIQGNQGDPGQSFTLKPTVADETALNAVISPSEGDGRIVESTNTVWIYTDSAWSDTGANIVGPTGPAGTTDFEELDNVPATFPPSAHNHDTVYVKLAGSTMTGALIITRAGQAMLQLNNTNSPNSNATIVRESNDGDFAIAHGSDEVLAFLVEPAGTTVTAATAAITREKGDARYTSLTAASVFKAIYDTVADMVASTVHSVGDVVATLGYTTAGDGGGNCYEIVLPSTGIVDGGSFINLTGISGQAQGLFGRNIYASQFGAVNPLDFAGSRAAVDAAIAYADSLSSTVVAAVYDDWANNEFMYRARTVNKNGNQVKFQGQGNFQVLVEDVSEDPDLASNMVLNDLWFNAEVYSEPGTGSQTRINRSGTATMKSFTATGILSEFSTGSVRTAVEFTDAADAYSCVQARESGIARILTSTGILQIRDADGATVAALPIDSDGSDMYLRIDSNGNVKRSHPAAFKNQGGSGAPVDGTTVAYYRDQLYIDRTNNVLYRANVKSTDPDVSGTGSVWVAM